MFVYLDNSATTKPYDEVITKMTEGLKTFGNPSSLHRLGLDAERLLKTSRRQIASSVNCEETEIVFTGSGTEADSLAILGTGYALKRRGNKIITSKIEHKAVLENFALLESQGFEVVYLDVDKQGIIDMAQLEAELNDKTILVSVMWVNNETGCIQPISQIGKLVHKFENTVFHSDGVQAFGKINIDPRLNEVDLLSISAHKIHGPKGVGALYIKKGIRLEPVILGGSQESGLRSGTENIPGILGFSEAAKLGFSSFDARFKKVKSLKEYFLDGIKAEINDILINSANIDFTSPYVLNVSFKGIKGEVLLHMLEQDEIFVSTGSACSSKKKIESHVLKAMGLRSHDIDGAIRFSFSEFNTIDEIDYTLDKLKNSIKRMRAGTLRRR